MKQITYLITERDEDKKKKIVEFNIALIRDLKMGWFAIPNSFKEEFETKFGIPCVIETNVCSATISKDDIRGINATNWNV